MKRKISPPTIMCGVYSLSTQGHIHFNKLWLSFDKRAKWDLRLTKVILNQNQQQISCFSFQPQQHNYNSCWVLEMAWDSEGLHTLFLPMLHLTHHLLVSLTLALTSLWHSIHNLLKFQALLVPLDVQRVYHSLVSLTFTPTFLCTMLSTISLKVHLDWTTPFCIIFTFECKFELCS